MTRERPKSGPRVFDIQYYPLLYQGEITGAVGELRDETDREQRTQHLRVLDRVLHRNLRNDLTVIRGYAERFGTTYDGRQRPPRKSSRALTG